MASLVLLVATGVTGLRTDNFVVNCDDEALQRKVGHYAEVYRRDISIQWVGAAPPRWAIPHVIHVGKGRQYGLNRTLLFLTHELDVVNVDDEQILYSTLPHEVCHSVLQAHCGFRLPLWASEGIAMACERTDMGSNDPGRFARAADNGDLRTLFEQGTYPLFYENQFYGQAFSVTTFLVEKSGKRKFLDFVQSGHTTTWDGALRRTYGLNFTTLQADWWAWHQGRFPPAPGQHLDAPTGR